MGAVSTDVHNRPPLKADYSESAQATSTSRPGHERYWRYRAFALSWLAYFGFYLCRKNFSVAVPLLKSDLGYSYAGLAKVMAGYSALYAVGQFCSGVMSDHFGPRKVVGIGLFVIVIANVLMGFQASVLALGILLCINGAGQSTGWSALVKLMACWFSRRERGRVMAWWTTNYVLGGFAAMLLATYAATNPRLFPEFAWRRAFWAPALPLFFIALAFSLFVRNRPADVGLPAVTEDQPIEEGSDRASLPGEPQQLTSVVVASVLSDKSLWLLSASYFFIKLTRYAFLFWLPTYMAEGLHYSIASAGYLSSLYDLVGFTGVIIAGYASDKLFQSRRFPVGAIMLWGLSIACLLQPTLGAQGYKGNALGVSLIGILTYGPDSLVSGAAAQDVGSQRGAATAAGIINGVGSFGQAVSPFIVVFVSQRYGWNALFYFFVVLALIAGSLLAIRWNHHAHTRARALHPEARHSSRER